MLKFLAFMGSAIVGFLITFSLTAHEEIGAEVAKRLDEDFVEQCVARNSWPAALNGRERDVCLCMKDRFDARGITITDAFGDRRSEMQQIGNACASRFASGG